jgi:hypothetical protein
LLGGIGALLPGALGIGTVLMLLSPHRFADKGPGPDPGLWGMVIGVAMAAPVMAWGCAGWRRHGLSGRGARQEAVVVLGLLMAAASVVVLGLAHIAAAVHRHLR